MKCGWLKYWVQRRTVSGENGSSYEEVVFNETQYDYFKFRELKARKNGWDDGRIGNLLDVVPEEKAKSFCERERYYMVCEDVETWVDFLGERFLARLFRKSTHFFQGGNSWGVELMYLLSDYFDVEFTSSGRYGNNKGLLKAYETGGRNLYCYDPLSLSGHKDRLVAEGGACPAGRGRASEISACLLCPYQQPSLKLQNGVFYVQCRVPEFPGWPEKPLTDDLDFFKG